MRSGAVIDHGLITPPSAGLLGSQSPPCNAAQRLVRRYRYLLTGIRGETATVRSACRRVARSPKRWTSSESRSNDAPSMASSLTRSCPETRRTLHASLHYNATTHAVAEPCRGGCTRRCPVVDDILAGNVVSDDGSATAGDLYESGHRQADAP